MMLNKTTTLKQNPDLQIIVKRVWNERIFEFSSPAFKRFNKFPLGLVIYFFPGEKFVCARRDQVFQ